MVSGTSVGVRSYISSFLRVAPPGESAWSCAREESNTRSSPSMDLESCRGQIRKPTVVIIGTKRASGLSRHQKRTDLMSRGICKSRPESHLHSGHCWRTREPRRISYGRSLMQGRRAQGANKLASRSLGEEPRHHLLFDLCSEVHPRVNIRATGQCRRRICVSWRHLRWSTAAAKMSSSEIGESA